MTARIIGKLKLQRIATVEQFLERVEFDANGGCWLWARGVGSNGYGLTQLRGVGMSSHRASWLLHHGDMGDKYVLHRCDVRLCVNPDHLFLGTHAENMADMAKKGRAYMFDRRGERVMNAKLSEAQAIEIIRLAKAGTRNRLLSEQFGVASCTITAIVHGHRWKHLSRDHP